MAWLGTGYAKGFGECGYSSLPDRCGDKPQTPGSVFTRIFSPISAPNKGITTVGDIKEKQFE